MAKWMQHLNIREGSLTRQAARAGKTPAEFCRTSHEGVTAKRCALSKTFAKARRGKKRGKRRG